MTWLSEMCQSGFIVGFTMGFVAAVVFVAVMSWLWERFMP